MSESEGGISYAETQRVRGDQQRALKSARELGDIALEDIASLSPQDLQQKMQAWRIWVVTLGSLGNAQWSGNEAAKFFGEAKGVIDQYYEHPDVIPAAEAMTTAPEASNNEYQMRAEMFRDKGSYWLKLFSLTGNSTYLNLAAEEYRQAVASASEGSSANALAQMELFSVNRRRGIQGNFDEFSQAYNSVVTLTPEVGGWDRKAAASWMYMNEATVARNTGALKVGFNNLKDATREGNVSWQKYLWKRIKSSSLSVARRTTYTGDPASLALNKTGI